MAAKFKGTRKRIMINDHDQVQLVLYPSLNLTSLGFSTELCLISTTFLTATNSKYINPF